ncbi:MAG: DivIVA domain-containing protein [Clostridia bacterium]|nr:DivIVA domain-containing protein [Clostridia bacterium]
MSVSETFDRKFNKSMRGYNTEEVDAALDALLRYCDELEDANREFEIANNDLIDDKTDLNKIISELRAEKEALEHKVSEMTERVSHVEGLYNNYREKFGEARDMITKAKSSSAEIIARAQAKAELIAEEAAEKHKKTIEEFDREIEKRRILIENLDICYNDFNEALRRELRAMLGKVDSFSVKPILPDELPEKRIVLSAAETVAKDDEEEEIIADIPVYSENNSEIDNEDDEVETVSDPIMTPYDLDSEPDEAENEQEIISAPQLQIRRESSSKISGMKDSLDAINQKVLKKKSTPHI